jgi:hypothetical protein
MTGYIGVWIFFSFPFLIPMLHGHVTTHVGPLIGFGLLLQDAKSQTHLAGFLFLVGGQRTLVIYFHLPRPLQVVEG